MRLRWAFLLVVVIILGGCQGDTGALMGSSKNQISGDVLPSADSDSRSVRLSELEESPGDFLGDKLLVRGYLSKPEENDCSAKSRTYPAAWRLDNGESAIAVTSQSVNLRNLSKVDSEVQLEGIWLHWEGQVGCGSQVKTEDQYYLEIVRVESPNPIALVPVVTSQVNTLGISDMTSTASAAGSTGSPSAAESETLAAPSAPSSPGDQGLMTPTIEPSTAAPTATTVPPETVTPPTETAPPVDQTPTETVIVPTDTATPTSEAALPTPLATINQEQSIFQKILSVSSIETGNLGLNETHRWTHEITATKRLTVSVASAVNHDIEITIRGPSGQIAAQQNNATGSEPEILADVTLIDPGVYDILISSPTGDPGYYAILINDQDSYPYHFQGTLRLG
ncbi:MAG: hypothetical protein ACK2T3_15465, partial [Candidatus Promineifilaceae bacterium]